jgi:hypothetical protein
MLNVYSAIQWSAAAAATRQPAATFDGNSFLFLSFFLISS